MAREGLADVVLVAVLCGLAGWGCTGTEGALDGVEAGSGDRFARDAPMPEVVSELQAEVRLSDALEETRESRGADVPDAQDASLPQVAPGRVLLLDLEMRHPVSWAFLMGELEALGHEVHYRRWYPHVTRADVNRDQGTAELPNQLVVVSAGNAPSEPSPRLRPEDAENLVLYLESGGHVVFLVRHGWLDGYGGDCDWLFMNRVLEAAKVAVRVERNTAIGFVSQGVDGKPPLHQSVAAAYPGSLEWTLNYPVGYPAADQGVMAALGPFAAGVTATLTCDGDDVAVLARTHKNILLWRKLEQSADAVSIPLEEQPLAVLAPSGLPGAGMVAVLPRSVVQLPVHTEYMSDKPVLDLGLLDGTESVARTALGHISAVARDASVHAPQGCHVVGDGGLLSAVGDGLPALGDGGRVEALYPPSGRPVADAPPEPPAGAPSLEEAVALGPPSEETATPDWYVHGRARVGWGSNRPYDEMKAYFEHAMANGVRTFIVGIDSQWLIDYFEVGGESPPFAELAAAAHDSGAQLFLGVNWLTAVYGQVEAEIGKAVGGYGQELKAPPPLNDVYWEQAIRPMFLGAALAQAAHPGIAGINLDMELYGAGALWYAQGYAFDSDTWGRVEAAIESVSEDLAGEAAGVEAWERLAWLQDRGLVGLAYGALEEETALRVAVLVDEARQLSPALEISVYGVMVSTAWFYRGWLRGAGTAQRPVTHLTYDIATDRTRTLLANEGIHVRILGGVLGVLFDPGDLGTGLLNAGSRADGYWLFQFTDFPYDSEPALPPKLNGAPDAYWEAIKGANAALDALTE